MWKLHRYYLREVAASSVLTFLVLFGIVLVSTIYRGLDRARGFGLLAAAETTLYFAADTVPHLLSISLLFATVLTFARASQDREITAIRSAGISPRVAMASALLVGMCFSIVGSYALHYVIPKAHFHKYRVVAEALRQVVINTGLSDDKVTLQGLVITWDSKTEDGRWRDVTVFVSRAPKGSEWELVAGGGVFTADEAWMETDRTGERLGLVFHNFGRPGFGVMTEEGRVSINLREIAEENRRNEGEKDMTSDQLLAEVYRGVSQQPGAARYHVHRRACFALMPCLFAPIGFCLGVLARDRGRMLALVLSLVPLFLFYLSDLLGAKLARSTDLVEFAWLPAATTVVLGVPFCWRLLRY